MYCPRCGTKNKETAKFCKNCGHKIAQAPTSKRKERPNYILIAPLAIGAVLVLIVVLFSSGKTGGALIGNDIPNQIEDAFFQESPFADPVTLTLQGDSGASLRSARNAGCLNFLISEGYAREKTVKTQVIGTEMEVEHLIYNETIDPYIYSGEYKSDSHFKLLLAERRLLDVSSTNEEEQLGEKYFAINFTYTLKEILPGLPDVDREFEGSAEFYWDPSKGEWITEWMSLEDTGEWEYFTP